MKIPAYIINLPSSVVRKEYMEALLEPFNFLDKVFIAAINGRQMSEEQRKDAFDYKASMEHYGRALNEGEVGCALSHRLSYRTLLDSDNPFALVLEDDITVMRDWNTLPWDSIERILCVSEPRVLFLSGDYWRLSSKNITRVFDAVGAYAYLINRAAAERILSVGKPYVVADDWMTYKRLGIRYFAVYPYAADANLVMDKLSSDVNQYSWTSNHKSMSKVELVRRIFPSMVKRIMKGIGLFESKVRVVDNKPEL